jgi:hypothetical protein
VPVHLKKNQVMHVKLVFAFSVLFGICSGQYYYNDLVVTQQGNDQYRVLRTQKIHSIKAVSFEADNSITSGFQLQEDISLDGKKIVMSAAIADRPTSITNRFYELNRLRRSQSVNNGIDTRTDYSYNEKGWLTKVLLTTKDTAMKSTLTESHEWLYDAAGRPESMLKIKNNTDTTLIAFVKDAQGVITEEHWKKKNRTLETYYYYYDSTGRLSDIVRYNLRLKKLIPDFQFEYDAAGRLTQLTQVSLASASYLIWKYTYNEKGLKQSETAFDRDRKLAGRIEYSYE